ncbi:MAG: FecR domain-containing protein [Candidatus Binatia bacterium]
MTRAGLGTFVAALLLATGVNAQDAVGTVAAVNGTAEIVHGGAAAAAAVGAPVQLGDELRTGAGKMKVVFRDDSVVDLNEQTSLVVDQQVFDPGTSRFQSLMKLLSGKARALVSDHYGTPGSSYEVETPTAVAGVRGTTFLISYDPDTDATQVIGIDGRIEVRSLAARLGDTVYVGAREGTTVLRGQPPTPPQPVAEDIFRFETDAIQTLGAGGAAGAGGIAGSGVQSGSSVPAPEKAPPSSGGATGQVGTGENRNAGDVAGQPLEVINSGRGRLGVP